MQVKLASIFVTILLSFSYQAQTEFELISKESIEIQTCVVGFTFYSNRYIAEGKGLLLEERLKYTFPNLIQISINVDTQKIEVLLPEGDNSGTLVNILFYFNTEDYETF